MGARMHVRRTWTAAAAVAVLAVVLRVAVAAVTVGLFTPADREPAADSRIHAALADNLRHGRGFSLDGQPTADTPPLYVVLLAGVYELTDSPAVVRIVQAALGGLSVLFLYMFATNVLGHRRGLVAAALLATFPHAVYISGLHLTENLFVVLVLAAAVVSRRLAVRPRVLTAVGLGGLLGLAALTRAVFVAFLPLVILWALGTWGWRQVQAYRLSAAALAAAAAVLLPWLVRNHVVLGAALPVQANGGMVFWAANNPHADGGLVWPTRSTWQAGPPPDDGRYGWRSLSPGEENRLYVQTALAWIRSDPAAFGRLVLKKLGRLYGFSRAEDGRDLPAPRAVRLVYGGVMAAAAAGVVSGLRWWRPLLFVLLLAAFTNLTVVIFSGASRYLLPTVPALAILASVALVRAGEVLAQYRAVAQVVDHT
jgi:4-amino-4-deoxy-L-arabinose transferase-like glycosyltransferase